MKKLCVLMMVYLSLSAKAQLTYSNITIPSQFNSIPAWGIACSYYDATTQTLYLGGGFTALGTTTRNRIAAIDAVTGAIKSWAPIINNGTVYSIKKKGNLLYVAGNFTQVNGTPANCLVSIDETTGNLVNTYPFLSGDVVYDFDINGNNIAAGGTISQYNGNPISGHMVVFDRITTFQTIVPINAVYSGHKLAKVNKLKYINNDIYISGNDSIGSMQNHSIFKLNTTNSNLILYLSAFNLSGYISMDDFSFDSYENMLYVIGDFMALDIFNNVPYTGPASNYVFAVKIDLSTNSILNWQPLSISNYPFIPTAGVFASGGCTIGDAPGTYNPYHDLYTYKILSIGSGIAVSKGYSNYIHVYDRSTANLIDSISSTNSVLFQDYPTPGKPYHRFLDFHSNNDKLFVLTTFPNTNSPKCFPFDSRVYEYCVPPRDFVAPIESSGKTIFCRGASYQFVQPRGGDVNNFQWTYSGTGATISGNGNDTISISFSYGASPGQLQVYGITACGKMTNTVSANIPFYSLPNIYAGRDTSLNCYNSKSVVIKASSTTLNPHSFKWSGPITPVNNYSVLVNNSGPFYATILDSTNFCTNIDTLFVSYDTLKPTITTLSSYTAGCSSNTIILNASSSSPQDSLWWFIGSNNFSNPATYVAFTPSTVVYAYDKAKSNGCINSKPVTVYFNNTPPSYTLVSTINTAVSPPQFLPITCINDSVLLDANASPSCKIKWQLPMSTLTVTNPYYAISPGIYQLHVTDTVTGCSNVSFFGQIPVDQYPPTLIMPFLTPNINCSYNTATLVANSLTPGASIQWVAPSVGYSGTNPAIVNQVAWYYATATNPSNGCTKKDSLLVTQQNILILNRSEDSTICNGSSVQLTVSPVGGTPSFTYNWTNGAGSSSVAIVSPTTTTNFVVTINDAGGCVGLDSIKITVPPVLQDSILTFTSCNPLNPAGQIQAYAIGGIPPYRFSIDNGATFQNTGVFLNQAYGTYSVVIRDTLNCQITATTVVSATSTAPSPDFIVNTSMMQGDTFVVVDISNPRPDSVQWAFPSGVQIIDNSNPFSPVIVCADTGYFSVQLNAFFGNCQSSLTKLVHFSKFDTAFANLYNSNGIQSVNLFPNPNSGQFSVSVSLYKKQTFVIKIFDASSVELLRIPVNESSSSTIPVNMPVTAPGTYILKVISEFDAKQQAFIISQ